MSKPDNRTKMPLLIIPRAYGDENTGGEMRLTRQFKRVLSLVLALSLIFSMTACSSGTTDTGLSDPEPQTITENIEVENIETETVLTEFITSEIYLEELVVAEDKISELLLEEETINEVLICKTIYVPQENIAEFSEHSQMAGLFGEEVNLSSVLTKVAVGTGVIVTLVVLRKAGVPKPVASIVAAAADKSLKFAGGGAAIGSLFGGLTGAVDEIDPSERTSAVIGFAAATAGLIIAITFLTVSAHPVGSTIITAAAESIKLVIARISVAGAAAKTVNAGYNAVKTFTSTDVEDIDWDNIDWDHVGASAAQKAIQNGADGYMWGSIIGAVQGGAEGYEFYQKYNTPYSNYDARLMQTPKDGKGGHWKSERGESEFILDEPITCPDGTKIAKVSYKNAVPDFSPYQEAQVKIPGMTNSRSHNFKQADEALAEYWTQIKHNSQTWLARDIEAYRTGNGLTWHEMNNMESMQLVPSEVNSRFGHLGGVGEYNVMIGEEGVADFD